MPSEMDPSTPANLQSLCEALLSNDLQGLSRGINNLWPTQNGDYRLIVLTALCMFAAKDKTGLKNLLSSLDASLFNHTVLAALKESGIEAGLQPSALKAFREHIERIRNSELSDRELGFSRAACPVQAELNGDTFWIFADLLPFVWHVVQQPLDSTVLTILAETEHYNWVKDRLSPGMCVLDVGANIGMFTNMMSRKVGSTGKVAAFEPNPPVFADLKRMVSLNALANVELFPVAASDSEGFATFNQVLVGDVNREASGLDLGKTFTEAPGTKIEIATTTLDKVVSSNNYRPDLVKIDVEGAEWNVLQGFTESLRQYKPKMVIEFHPDSSGHFDHASMEKFLKDFGYNTLVQGKNYFCE